MTTAVSAGMLVVCVLLSTCTQSQSVNPGAKVRITQKGIDYANSVAQAALATSLKTLKIPDQSGHDHGLDWSLTNIQNRGVQIPTSQIKLVSGVGLSWTISGLGLNLHADWRVKYKKGWFKVSTSGDVDVDLSGVTFTVGIKLGKDGNGRPTVAMASCAANIGSVHVKFHGGASFIYNLFSGVVERKIKDLLPPKLCDTVSKEVNVDGNARLAKLKVETELAHTFLLDYRLVTAPVVTAGYMETSHKGEIYWKGDEKEAPFSPAPIPPLSDVSRMLYLWLTDYMARTYTYVAHTHGYLRYNVTKDSLPEGNKTFLDTTCKWKCIGAFIPQIRKRYPNAWVELQLNTTAPPVVNMSSKSGGSLTFGIKGDIKMLAHTSKGQTPYLLTLNMTLNLNAKVTVKSQRIYGEIKDSSFSLGVVRSAIGKVDVTVLNLVMKGAMDLVIIPMFNGIAQKGMDLPVTGEVTFQNTHLTFLNGSVMIATDLKYTPSDLDETDATSDLPDGAPLLVVPEQKVVP